MTMQCPSCGCIQHQGLLCSDCCSALETMLSAVPQLIDQLNVAVAKQAKIGGNGKAGKGSAHERNPVNWDVAAVRDSLLVELALWARDVSNDTWRPDEDEVVVVRAASVPWIGPFHDQCLHPSCERMRMVWVNKAEPVGHQVVAFLANQSNAIRKHPAAADIVSGIGRAVKDAFRAIDRLQERTYLGQCLFEEDGLTCHAEIWARPGAHQVTCTQCGITHEVGERRAWLLQQARDMLFTVKDASLMIGEVGRIQVTEASIRGYLHRKRIAYRPGGNLIRLGDLLAVVLDDSERKTA